MLCRRRAALRFLVEGSSYKFLPRALLREFLCERCEVIVYTEWPFLNVGPDEVAMQENLSKASNQALQGESVEWVQGIRLYRYLIPQHFTWGDCRLPERVWCGGVCMSAGRSGAGAKKSLAFRLQ